MLEHEVVLVISPQRAFTNLHPHRDFSLIEIPTPPSPDANPPAGEEKTLPRRQPARWAVGHWRKVTATWNPLMKSFIISKVYGSQLQDCAVIINREIAPGQFIVSGFPHDFIVIL